MILPTAATPYSLAFLCALPHGLVAGLHLPPSPDPVPEDVLARLLPTERAAALSMRGFRQVQFTGGRLALAVLFQELGAYRHPILPDGHGAPTMPHGLVGSISHKQDLVVATLARGQGGIGIDLEETDRERPGVAERVLRPEELEAIAGLTPARAWCDAMIRFSVKESIYKAIHRYMRRYVDFKEVAVWPTPEGADRVDTFFGPSEGPFHLDARHTWIGNRVLSTVRAHPL